jgi:hypothetical protein
VADGTYDLFLTVQSGSTTTKSKVTVNVGNYLQNPGFETDSNGDGLADYWQAMNATGSFSLSSDKVEGEKSQRLVLYGNEGGVRQEWTAINPGQTYTVEAWVKVESGSLNIVEAEADAGFKHLLGNGLKQRVSNRDWQKYTFTFKPNPKAVNASIRFVTWSEGRTVAYVDKVVFKPAN